MTMKPRKPRTPEEDRKRSLWYNYKITPERYEQLFRRQGRVCAVCRQPPTMRRALAVDHEHTTGRVRELLCTKCNVALGLLGDNRYTIYSLLNYIDPTHSF
ncbi:MAG: hypothetical protein PVSMB7_23360 [Chloroflexota bacterium]